MGCDGINGLFVGLIDQDRYGEVDLLADSVTVVSLFPGHATAQEDLLLGLAEGTGSAESVEALGVLDLYGDGLQTLFNQSFAEFGQLEVCFFARPELGAVRHYH